MELNHLIDSSQYGFRSDRSCELALNTLIEDWRDSLDRSNFIISIFLDLSKAFDTVDHKLLLKKFKFYNFDPSLINLLSNYLNERFIRVNIEGNLSKSEQIEVGVPQGSVLGPLLFIIFINDLTRLRLSSTLLLFADDTTMYLCGKDLNEVLAKVKQDLHLVKDWLAHNRLILNLSKTQAI